MPESGLPATLVASMEADIIPMDNSDEKRNLIDATIGELSAFHELFGVYGQGVSLTTSILPAGWMDRLVALGSAGRPPEAIGLCLEPHDLCIAKMYAGRPQDWRFCIALVRANLVDVDIIDARLADMRAVYGPPVISMPSLMARSQAPPELPDGAIGGLGE